MDASASVGIRRETTARSRRGKISLGRIEIANTLYQQSSSGR
jgi:hypothetical protein